MSVKQLLLMMLIILVVTSEGHAQANCPLDLLDSEGVGSPSISFRNFRFEIGLEDSHGTLEVVNRGTMPISAMFAVLNFYSSGRYILSMNFNLATTGSDSFFKPLVQPPLGSAAPAPLNSSLLTGQAYRDQVWSPLRPGKCPDEARLVLLQVGFANRTVFDRRAKGWRADPMVSSVRPWETKQFPTKPLVFFARLSVNEQGRAHVVAMGIVGKEVRADSAVSDWLDEALEGNLSYSPALYDGFPISTQLNVLVRFYPKVGIDPDAGVRQDWLGLTSTVIDLNSADQGKNYSLTYGGVPFIGKGFPKITRTDGPR